MKDTNNIRVNRLVHRTPPLLGHIARTWDLQGHTGIAVGTIILALVREQSLAFAYLLGKKDCLLIDAWARRTEHVTLVLRALHASQALLLRFRGCIVGRLACRIECVVFSGREGSGINFGWLRTRLMPGFCTRRGSPTMMDRQLIPVSMDLPGLTERRRIYDV